MTDNASTRVYLLRFCEHDFASAHDRTFIWPSVVGTDVHPRRWNPEPTCGDGLHGFVRGEGDASLADWSDSAQWLVFSADSADVVAIGEQKSKARVARVEHVGQGETGAARRLDCLVYLERIGQCGAFAMGVMRQGGHGSTVTGGDRSTVTGGDGSTVTGGYGSTVTGGDGSTVMGGNHSALSVRWWDGARYRIAVAYVGEDGIEAGARYKVNAGKFVQVDNP